MTRAASSFVVRVYRCIDENAESGSGGSEPGRLPNAMVDGYDGATSSAMEDLAMAAKKHKSRNSSAVLASRSS